MVAALSDESPEVRQAAAYGFGIMGQVGGIAYAEACAGNVFTNMELLILYFFFFWFDMDELFLKTDFSFQICERIVF